MEGPRAAAAASALEKKANKYNSAGQHARHQTGSHGSASHVRNR